MRTRSISVRPRRTVRAVSAEPEAGNARFVGRHIGWVESEAELSAAERR